jgi:hypothetical protein
MADEKDQNDGLGDITADEAEQSADEAPKDQPERPETADKDWQAEAEKWRTLSRKNEKSFKDTAAKLQKYEDANKSESQRLQEERDLGLSRAEKAEAALKRREIAESRAPEHATPAHIRAVAKRLAGESDEDLESDADELFELIAPGPKAAPKVAGSRPKERLKGGSEPDEQPEVTDPRKLAGLIPRRR